jgi:hypothetical protein
MTLPVVEYLALSAGVDHSPNIALSINLSQWQRRQWGAQGGDLARSEVIYVPAEPPASTDDLRAELGIPADALVAGFHQRAQDEIFSPIPLQAFAEVRAPGRWFVLMGGGPAYRRQAEELGLDNVVFLDHRDERMTDHRGAAGRISMFLNTLDVFAHGRRDGETFGAVLAEAMMHERPCLSHRSDVANAQPETMGPAGLFAEDAAEYADALGRLLADAGLRAKLAAKARPHAERYYSLATCVGRLEDAYGRVLTGAPPRPGRPIAYGHTDLGCLLAGDVDDPGSPAHCVVAGGIPDEPAVDLLRALLATGAVDQVHVAGGADSVLAPTAAQAGVAVSVDQASDALRATFALNNWEERLAVDPAAAQQAGLVALDGPPSDDLLRARPAFLLRGDAAPLRAAGYTVAAAGRRGGWHAAVHPSEHAALHAVLAPWRARRRRLAARRAVAAPAQALSRRVARARPAIGRLLGR